MEPSGFVKQSTGLALNSCNTAGLKMENLKTKYKSRYSQTI